MFPATAATSASIWIETPIYDVASAHRERAERRYIRMFVARRLEARDTRAAEPMLVLRSLPARWLSVVQNRIHASIIPDDAIENDGRWLRRESADAACTFLDLISDLLPSEPFIYGSKKGDLVAEFKAADSDLTTIVSPARIILYAVSNAGETIEKAISTSGAVREEVKEFMSLRRKGQHGAMGAAS